MERPGVLAVGAGRIIESALAGCEPEWEADYERALDKLLAGRHEVAIVASDLPGGIGGNDLIRDLVKRGATTPLILGTTSGDHRLLAEAALRAGAVDCLDLVRADPADCALAVAFARAVQQRAARRDSRVFQDMGQFLVDEGRGLLTSLAASLDVIGGSLSGAPERMAHADMRNRLNAFRKTIEMASIAMSLSVKLPAQDRVPGTSREAPPEPIQAAKEGVLQRRVRSIAS